MVVQTGGTMAKKLLPANRRLRDPVLVMVSAALRRRVESRARAERMSLSALGRKALEQYLAQRNGGPDAVE